jgi:sulfoxide reductase heme-binding subunit YedZ
VAGGVTLESTVASLSSRGTTPLTVPELVPGPERRPVPSRAESRAPALQMFEPDPDRRLPALGRPVALVTVILGVSLLIGHLAGTQGQTLVHNKMLPWILGRSLGVGSYVSLTTLVILGLWLRHPWRGRFRRPTPEAILWAHVTLAGCTIALLVGHLTSLALDRYAGVGWTGVFVPWGAHFRPTAVALGTLAFYLLLLVVGTAALAGSIGQAVWLPIHTVSVVAFCMTLAHGVLAGSDSSTLRWFYVGSGALVLVLQFTRWIAGTLRHGASVVPE